jgi:hypothetical protein
MRAGTHRIREQHLAYIRLGAHCGLDSDIMPSLESADIVAKVFFG